jgi:hypothetical protein
MLLTVSAFAGAQQIHHNIVAITNIDKHTIRVKDEIFIPSKLVKDKNRIEFSLNDNLKIITAYPAVNQIDGGASEWNQLYWFKPAKKGKGYSLTIEYEGVIYDNFENDGAEYARGFSETRGIIFDKGIYLAASSHWIPQFDDALITFDMRVTLPEGWDMMSQGERKVAEDGKTVSYSCKTPQEEAYLIAAKFTVYEDKTGSVLLQAFLRNPDEELAGKYLKMTAVYLKMYEDMLGNYPYSKFALVENFWETGYGMPSFTLLGEKIIRFPFIIYSSYPHELLHNYWGNSVYVDYNGGNWCEGITAYMADHMLKEQRGQGAAYRRNTLEKFTDFVNEDNDFPVSKFINRNNAAEEAIGYGKCLMINHMLRKEVGDKAFLEAYRNFYENNRYRRASFDDIRKAFNNTTGRDFKPYFDFWINSKGAPELKLTNIKKEKVKASYSLSFTLEQVQSGDAYPLNVPVAIYYPGRVVLQHYKMDKKAKDVILESEDEPLRIEVDPQFDLFRKLDKAEVPPTLSQVFGSKNGVIILPEASKYYENYKAMAEAWKKNQEAQGKTVEIVTDKDIDVLPAGKAVWVFGFENKFYSYFSEKKMEKMLGGKDLTNYNAAVENGSVVLVIDNPVNSNFSIGFVGTSVPAAIPGLTRLLPHYGKYSYLGFKGSRPDNFLKGNFPAQNSPLHYTFPDNSQPLSPDVKLKPSPALTN